MAPPEDKESNTFSVIIDDLDSIQDEFLSPVYRINGYPWCLKIGRWEQEFTYHEWRLICDKSSEAALWKCTADFTVTWSDEGVQNYRHLFTSWDLRQSFRLRTDLQDPEVFRGINGRAMRRSREMQIIITTKEDGNSWTLFPIMNFCISDCILLCGKNKEKVHVNKKSLTSHSPFFDKLFNGDFTEKNMKEIPIGDVEGEEFLNLIKLLYRYDDAYLSDQNVHRVAQLADRFELKFVEDRVTSYLLSSTTMAVQEKLVISCLFNLHFLIENLNTQSCSVKDVSEYQEFELFSEGTLRMLIKKFCPRIDKVPSEWWAISAANTMEDPRIISMTVEKWKPNQTEQFSDVQYKKGYPWRLRLFGKDGNHYVSLICDKSNVSELWQCTATFSLPYSDEKVTHVFNSWDSLSLPYVYVGHREAGSNLQIGIAIKEDGLSWRLRPILEPLDPLDGRIVIGGLKMIRVNKLSLASQSPFFEKLFFDSFGEFKDEYYIEDVEYEEFANIIKLVYRYEGASLTDENVDRVLQLAVRFQLDIVVDKVISLLLQSAHLSLEPIHRARNLSKRYDLHHELEAMLKETWDYQQMKKMIESPEFEQFSIETLRIIFKKNCI